MYTENKSTEGVTDIKLEKESDDEVESQINLYADHEIKEEMVIGPVVLQRVVNATDYYEDIPTLKKPRLEVNDEKTEQVEPHQKEIIEDNTVEIVTHVIKKKRKKVRNKEQTKCYNLRKYKQTLGIDCDILTLKKPRLEAKDEKTEQVEPHQKEIIEDNTVEIVSNVIKKKRKKVRNKEQTKCYNLRKYKQTPGIDCDVPVAKKIKLKVKDEKTDQVELKKEIIEEILFYVDIKNETTVKEEQSKTLRKCYQTPGITCNDGKNGGKKFRKICELAQHIVSHEKIKQDDNYKCKECTYQTGSQDSLEQHYKLHDIHRNFVCDLCGYRSEKKYELLNHFKSKHSHFYKEKEFVCGHRSKKKSYLAKHVRTHTGKKPYSCSECEYKSANKGDLTKHLRVHTGEKPYSCFECEYRCTTKSGLIKHLRTHTGEKPYSCSECEYRCANNSALIVHLRIHTGEKPYSCFECEYKTASNGCLTKHLRTHTGEKPYSCSECEYKCANKSCLTKHLRTHTGEKPYSCSECEYKCANKSQLTTHLRTHSGEKPYSCFECQYKCGRKSNLTEHLRTHSGEKPYSCSECDYKCTKKSYLTKHLRTHTGGKP